MFDDAPLDVPVPVVVPVLEEVVPDVPVVPVVVPADVLVDELPRRSSSICAVRRAIAALSTLPEALIDPLVCDGVVPLVD